MNFFFFREINEINEIFLWQNATDSRNLERKIIHVNIPWPKLIFQSEQTNFNWICFFFLLLGLLCVVKFGSETLKWCPRFGVLESVRIHFMIIVRNSFFFYNIVSGHRLMVNRINEETPCLVGGFLFSFIQFVRFVISFVRLLMPYGPSELDIQTNILISDRLNLEFRKVSNWEYWMANWAMRENWNERRAQSNMNITKW